MIAQTAKRLTRRQKEIARYEAEMFQREIGYMFTDIDRDRLSGEYAANFVDPEDNDNWTTAEIVRCPHCNEIQVCYGQYGDPETEICICSQCHNDYKVEF